jgi:fatty-acyl-CoA synthase
VAAGPEAPSIEDVTAFLAERLPRYKMPRDIWFIEAVDLPKTGTGKVQKNLLREQAERRLIGSAAA